MYAMDFKITPASILSQGKEFFLICPFQQKYLILHDIKCCIFPLHFVGEMIVRNSSPSLDVEVLTLS